MNSNMLDIKQCAEFLNVSISLIRKLVRKNKIPYNRIGAKLLFPKNEIDIWLKENQNNIEY
ncbi:MAG: helix-turn-helix domain-containing protein [Clostridium sp.]|nr:helix-turn-helix domain-containing protein [Clostridium sp.]MCM1444175.1 helix-turn-helix domain-containing protein [Candidatus Amulumruptor caecigallinarius]